MTDRSAFRSANPECELLDAIRSAAVAGVDLIQIREKNLETHALLDLVRGALGVSRATAAKILVNDRLDVALAAGAAGVHAGENSLPVKELSEWRRGSGNAKFLIGVSCHSKETAQSAEREGADYILFGPVFATPSKAAFGPPQGIERLREICMTIQIPVLAIGGISLGNAKTCFEVGAAGIAAIRLFQESNDIHNVVAQLKL